MHITQLFPDSSPTFSFEFFPPKSNQGVTKLLKVIEKLEVYNPDFVSVTYGAGGSTRDMTHDLVVQIKKRKKTNPIPHLTCVCHNKNQIDQILERYAKEGVCNILALGGDVPQNLTNYDRSQDDFRYASELVNHIQKFNQQGKHPNKLGFGIGVAGFPEGHPATPNRLLELEYLKAKVDAGANYIVTQLFFDNHDFLDFRDRCRLIGINVPIIAGIMPITAKKGMKRMAELAAGAHFPAKLLRALDRANNDDESIKRVGIHYATQQCVELLENNVDGIHFYTLNDSSATQEIYANLGINPKASKDNNKKI